MDDLLTTWKGFTPEKLMKLKQASKENGTADTEASGAPERRERNVFDIGDPNRTLLKSIVRANEIMYRLTTRRMIKGLVPEKRKIPEKKEKKVEFKTKDEEAEEMNKAMSSLQRLKMSGYDPWDREID